MHPRNRNIGRYDIPALVRRLPDLGAFVQPSKSGEDTIDFSQPEAVKLLNRALMLSDYGLDHWDFPEAHLCPPVPGRADYLHHMADLLSVATGGKVPKGPAVRVLDVGVGATAIYPIVGIVEYGWSFVGCDISKDSLASSASIVASNPVLQGQLECRHQSLPERKLGGMVAPSERFAFTMCNPPFHASAKEAMAGTMRKTRNLKGRKAQRPMLNFGGVSDELICEGGEVQFIQAMIEESKDHAAQVMWFSTLVSKRSHMKVLYAALNAMGPKEVKTMPMGTGNKSTRILTWTFLSKEERTAWLTEVHEPGTEAL
ncbi:23S rRNA (adenine(1618)-N(6))-methyltransferase RlmF [Flavobacteriales bacterium]|nr:23S rRNA (adenine(1618)-N(6))-methyltransferase RlmF [Flavobacteriales bacterium]